METSEENTLHFETQIKFKGIEIKLHEVDDNLICFDAKPVLPNAGNNYDWDLSLSVDPDTQADDDYDEVTCYLLAKLHMKGEKDDLIKVNTLHSYHLSKRGYKKAHEEIFKSIAREAVEHANLLLAAKAKGTEYEGFLIPAPDEDWLAEDANEWNRRYIPAPEPAKQNTLGRKPTRKELDEMSARAAELVEFIDAYDEKKETEHSEEETTLYWQYYAEWSKINKLIWHYKLIGRNNIAYISHKIIVRLEKGLAKDPENYLLREAYEDMKENYMEVMNEFKQEFAKN